MGGHHREGENDMLRRSAEGALGGAIAGAIGESLRLAYQPGFQNGPRPGAPYGIPNEGQGQGQNQLPRFEIDRMHEDSRMAANDLLRSGGRDQRLAQTELQHAALVDRQYDQHGRYYQEALRELGRDVKEQSRDHDRLAGGQGYNGRPDLQIVPNDQPLYNRPPAQDNYYNQRLRNPGLIPQERFKR